jgi:hypothetical protein
MYLKIAVCGFGAAGCGNKRNKRTLVLKNSL